MNPLDRIREGHSTLQCRRRWMYPDLINRFCLESLHQHGRWGDWPASAPLGNDCDSSRIFNWQIYCFDVECKWICSYHGLYNTIRLQTCRYLCELVRGSVDLQYQIALFAAALVDDRPTRLDPPAFSRLEKVKDYESRWTTLDWRRISKYPILKGFDLWIYMEARMRRWGK